MVRFEMSLPGMIYDELRATGDFTQGEASYYSKGIANRIESMGMDERKVKRIRKCIWREMKRFMKVGTDIQILEAGPEIFYNTEKLSEALETIMKVVTK